MQAPVKQTVVLSFLQYPSGRLLWAMKQMALVPRMLQGVPGLTFFKMLGTGGGRGYSSRPDFTTYAILTVWDRTEDAFAFENGSRVMDHLRSRTMEIYSIFMHPVSARGKWSGKEPFHGVDPDPANPLIVALTRATLKPRFYLSFWKRVGAVSRSQEDFPGQVFSKGIGERPWVMQATFSVWRSLDEMQAFAYGEGGKHMEAIATTRRLNGFREEMFARLQPFDTRGTWNGTDPLGDALKRH